MTSDSGSVFTPGTRVKVISDASGVEIGMSGRVIACAFTHEPCLYVHLMPDGHEDAPPELAFILRTNEVEPLP